MQISLNLCQCATSTMSTAQLEQYGCLGVFAKLQKPLRDLEGDESDIPGFISVSCVLMMFEKELWFTFQ